MNVWYLGLTDVLKDAAAKSSVPPAAVLLGVTASAVAEVAGLGPLLVHNAVANRRPFGIDYSASVSRTYSRGPVLIEEPRDLGPQALGRIARQQFESQEYCMCDPLWLDEQLRNAGAVAESVAPTFNLTPRLSEGPPDNLSWTTRHGLDQMCSVSRYVRGGRPVKISVECGGELGNGAPGLIRVEVREDTALFENLDALPDRISRRLGGLARY